MANEIYLDFCIWNFDDITHQEITQILGITPSKIYVKGKPTNPKLPQNISKVNGWRMGSGLNKQFSFEEQMEEMLRIIEEKIELFKPICEKYHTEFSCAIYSYQNSEESFPSVHLNSRYNSLIKKLNIEFDLDVYILSR